MSGSVTAINVPAHPFSLPNGAVRYLIMTTTQTRFTLDASPATFASLKVGQTATVRGLFRVRYRVAALVTLRSAALGPVSTVPATSSLTTALNNALVQGRYTLATYKNVVARFGAIPPFSHIIASEAQHVTTVTTLMTAHGVTVPASTTTGAVAPAPRTAACQLGVTIEMSVIAMYQNATALDDRASTPSKPSANSSSTPPNRARSFSRPEPTSARFLT